MPKRKNPLIAEFVVEVYEDHIAWNGLDAFLWWLIHRGPKESYLPHAKIINKFGRRRESQ